MRAVGTMHLVTHVVAAVALAGCAANAVPARAPSPSTVAKVAPDPVVAESHPVVDDDLNPGEAFARACGSTDFDHCRPFAEDDRALWERAIAQNVAAFEAEPSTKVGLVAGVRAAIAIAIVGEPARAAALYRRVRDAYSGEAALAPFADGAARGVDSEQAEYQARLDVIVPLLEHAAAADLAALDVAHGEADYEAIARATRLPLSERAPALVTAMKLARALGERERVDGLAKLAHELALPPGHRVEIDWLAATVDYARWDPTAPDEGANRQRRLAAVPALLAFHAAHRGVAAAAPWLVEAAYGLSELERVAGDPSRRDWLKKVGEAWAVVQVTTTDRDAGVVEHAALASAALLGDDIARDFDGWASTCATGNGAALFTLTNPYTGELIVRGAFDDKSALATTYERRIDDARLPFEGTPSVAAFHALDGRITDELRTCLTNADQRLVSGAIVPEPYVRYRIAHDLETTVEKATRAYTLAFVQGALSPASTKAQARLAALALGFGNLAIETTIRDTLGTGFARIPIPDELPGPGDFYQPQGARSEATPTLAWLAPLAVTP